MTASTHVYAPKSKWTQEQIEEAVRLRAEGLTIGQIAERIGREWNTVNYIVKKHGPRDRAYEKSPAPRRGRDSYVLPMCIPPEVLAARDVRLAAACRDNTAALCGDPPVGYSALDGR